MANTTVIRTPVQTPFINPSNNSVNTINFIDQDIRIECKDSISKNNVIKVTSQSDVIKSTSQSSVVFNSLTQNITNVRVKANQEGYVNPPIDSCGEPGLNVISINTNQPKPESVQGLETSSISFKETELSRLKETELSRLKETELSRLNFEDEKQESMSCSQTSSNVSCSDDTVSLKLNFNYGETKNPDVWKSWGDAENKLNFDYGLSDKQNNRAGSSLSCRSSCPSRLHFDYRLSDTEYEWNSFNNKNKHFDEPHNLDANSILKKYSVSNKSVLNEAIIKCHETNRRFQAKEIPYHYTPKRCSIDTFSDSISTRSSFSEYSSQSYPYLTSDENLQIPKSNKYDLSCSIGVPSKNESFSNVDLSERKHVNVLNKRVNGRFKDDMNNCCCGISTKGREICPVHFPKRDHGPMPIESDPILPRSKYDADNLSMESCSDIDVRLKEMMQRYSPTDTKSGVSQASTKTRESTAPKKSRLSKHPSKPRGTVLHPNLRGSISPQEPRDFISLPKPRDSLASPKPIKSRAFPNPRCATSPSKSICSTAHSEPEDFPPDSEDKYSLPPLKPKHSTSLTKSRNTIAPAMKPSNPTGKKKISAKPFDPTGGKKNKTKPKRFTHTEARAIWEANQNLKYKKMLLLNTLYSLRQKTTREAEQMVDLVLECCEIRRKNSHNLNCANKFCLR